MLLGTISEVWRYPVSSIGGERLPAVDVRDDGVDGDRRFALIDAENGFAAAPEMDKRWRKALFLSAAYGGAALPSVTFPDGTTLNILDRALNTGLSDFFGFKVAVAAIEDDQRPISGLPITQHRHPHSPVHLISTASLDHLTTLCPGPNIESRRFRPTAVISLDGSSFVEDRWLGKNLQAGTCGLTVVERTKRCGMTFLAQPGLTDEPDILRSILRNNQRHLGVNCSVVREGRLAEGDTLSLS